MSWTSSYLFDADTDPDEGLGEDEAENTLDKLTALYQQAKAGLIGGNKVNAQFRLPVVALFLTPSLLAQDSCRFFKSGPPAFKVLVSKRVCGYRIGCIRRPVHASSLPC